MTSNIKSLHELCFENIRKNILRHTNAFLKTKNSTLLKNLSYLQRLHTENLISQLIRHSELAEDHFNFLLNEFVRKLVVFPFLKCSSKETVVNKVLPIAHKLNELFCEREYFLENEIYWKNSHARDSLLYILKEILPHATSVTKICIPHICTDELLKLIASSCPQLNELNILKSTITGIGIEALCCEINAQNNILSALKYLNVKDTSLTIEDVALVLKNLPNIEEILFDGLPEVIKFLDSNSKNKTVKYNLQNLNFIGVSHRRKSSEVTELLKLCCIRCPNVKSLSVRVSNAQDLYYLSHFRQLEAVHLFCDPYVNLNNFLIRNGKNIKELFVESFSLSINKLIDNCPKLNILWLNSIRCRQLDDYSDKQLNKLEDLVLFEINFRNVNCRESILHILHCSPRLKSFELQYCKFGLPDMVSKSLKLPLDCRPSQLQLKNTAAGTELLHEFILSSLPAKTLQLDDCENIGWDDVTELLQIAKASNKDITIHCSEKFDIGSDDDEFETDDDDEEVDLDDEFDSDFENEHNPYVFWYRHCGVLRSQLRH